MTRLGPPFTQGTRQRLSTKIIITVAPTLPERSYRRLPSTICSESGRTKHFLGLRKCENKSPCGVPYNYQLEPQKNKNWQGEDFHGGVVTACQADVQTCSRGKGHLSGLCAKFSANNRKALHWNVSLVVQLHTCRRYADTHSPFWAVPCIAGQRLLPSRDTACACHACGVMGYLPEPVRLLECSLQARELRHVVSSIFCLLGFQNPLCFCSILFSSAF